MQYQRTASPRRREHLCALLRSAAIALSCALLSACPGSSPTPPPSVILSFSQPILYLQPGESAKVLVQQTRATPSLAEASQPRTSQPLPSSPLTLSLEQPEPFGISVLNVSVAANAVPGRHEVRFRREGEADVVYLVVVVPTEATARMGAAESLAAGEFHTLARKADGTVWAWGRNEYGQLGDGTLTDRTVPVQVTGLPLPAIAVAAGQDHSLVLLQDNTVWGFGRADDFQLRLSNRTIEAQPTPVQVSEAGTFAASIAAGSSHSMLRTGGGDVIAWGATDSGQTTSIGGLDNTTVAGLPFAATSISAAYDTSYAVLSDNMLWAWGDGSDGQLGPTANGPRAQARPVQTVDNVDQVATGFRHTLVLSNGTVRAFGDNAFSQLGDGSLARQTGQPVIVPRLLATQQVATGQYHSLALQGDRRVLQWGLSVNGQAGPIVAPPNDPRSYQLLPEVVLDLPSAVAIDAGARHSLAITSSSRSIYAWGNSSLGQQGDGTIALNRATVVPVYGTGSSNAERHTLAIVSRGLGTVSAMAPNGAVASQANATEGLAFAIAQGELVVLTAQPDAGSVFISWGGQASGNNPTTQVIMDRSRVCLARFGIPPRPDFEATTFFSTVEATAERNADEDGCIVAWEWDLGNDGSIDGTGQEFMFELGANPIDLRLRVTDNDGLSAEQVQTIGDTSPGSNPGTGTGNGVVADFYVLPELPVATLPITFGGYLSQSSSGPLVNWQWDFTNDGTFDASGEEVTFTFESPGIYNVRLVVTGPNGQTASVVKQVEVTLG
jgi:alpha-tubulin suppressor-like RCC1 family protein